MAQSDLDRRVSRLEERLNGKIFVSAEIFQFVINEIKKDLEEHHEAHKEERSWVRSIRLMLATAIITAFLGLLSSFVLFFIGRVTGS